MNPTQEAAKKPNMFKNIVKKTAGGLGIQVEAPSPAVAAAPGVDTSVTPMKVETTSFDVNSVQPQMPTVPEVGSDTSMSPANPDMAQVSSEVKLPEPVQPYTPLKRVFPEPVEQPLPPLNPISPKRGDEAQPASNNDLSGNTFQEQSPVIVSVDQVNPSEPEPVVSEPTIPAAPEVPTAVQARESINMPLQSNPDLAPNIAQPVEAPLVEQDSAKKKINPVASLVFNNDSARFLKPGEDGRLHVDKELLRQETEALQEELENAGVELPLAA